MNFEWDPAKAEANRRKHAVAFVEAVSVFGDPLSQTFYDAEHSKAEDRFATIGLSDRGRLLIVWHTDRASSVRLISARTPTRSESEAYTDARS